MRLYHAFILPLTLTIMLSSKMLASNIDSLEASLPRVSDSLKVKILCDLCWEYRSLSAEKALAYGNKALQLSKKIDDKSGIAQSYNDMGIVYIGTGLYDTALEYFNRSMDLRVQLKDSTGIASLYNKIGIIFQKQGDLKKALQNQLLALDIYKKLKAELWIGYSLNNIAIINQNLGNLNASLDYHKKALEYRIKMKDKYGEAGSYGNMANLYLKLNDTLKAMEYYQRALKLFRKIDDKEAISTMLNNLANIYIFQQKVNMALPLLKESLELRIKAGDQKAIASTLLRYGEAYLVTGEYNKAIETFYQTLYISKNIKVLEEEMYAYLNLGKAYKAKSLYDSAYKYNQLYVSLKDSVYSNRLKEQIVEMQTKYESKEMKHSIDLLKSEKNLAEIRLKQKHNENLILILVIFLILISSVFVFYRHKTKQKLEIDAAKLKYNEQKISAVIKGQEEERHKIARELHDGIGQKLASIKLAWSKLISDLNLEIKQGELNIVTSLIDQTAREVRTISHQMLPNELEKFGLIAAVESLVESVFKNQNIKVSVDTYGISNRFPAEVELTVYRILQELLSNIIKHSGAKKVKIDLLQKISRLYLIVEDDGVGFHFKSNNPTSGIGLFNIESRAKSVNGSVNFDTAIDKGTTVLISIPV